jgi:hypothetical protein
MTLSFDRPPHALIERRLYRLRGRTFQVVDVSLLPRRAAPRLDLGREPFETCRQR